MHRLVGASPAGEPDLTHAVGVIPLQPLLAALGKADRCGDLRGQSDDLVVREPAPVTAEDGDVLGTIDQFGQLEQIRFGRAEGWLPEADLLN